MTTVPLEDAQARLPMLIEQLQFEEEIVITRDRQPVARLIGAAKPASSSRRQLGTMKGSVRSIAADFDAPLEDFKEYTE
jgi:antitoxin (DNA-binding transcriptional repressor) of toxin-antitoxin stability system